MPQDEHAGEPISVACHSSGTTRVLSRKCATCIFTPGNPMHLRPGQLAELVNQARNAEAFIVCHDTLPYGPHPHAQPAVCRGFYNRYITQALLLARHVWGITEIEPPEAPTPAP